MVVSRSWSAFISPRPLNRCSETPWRERSSTAWRRAPKVSARLVPVAEADLERRRADLLEEIGVDLHQVAVLASIRRASPAACGHARGRSCDAPRGSAAPRRMTRRARSRTRRPPDPRPRMIFLAPASVAAPSSRILDSERNETISWPNSARSDSLQPSYSLRRRLKRCQRAAGQRVLLGPRVGDPTPSSSFSRRRSSSSSDSFSM